jgi:hypothetical protein
MTTPDPQDADTQTEERALRELSNRAAAFAAAGATFQVWAFPVAEDYISANVPIYLEPISRDALADCLLRVEHAAATLRYFLGRSEATK